MPLDTETMRKDIIEAFSTEHSQAANNLNIHTRFKKYPLEDRTSYVEDCWHQWHKNKLVISSKSSVLRSTLREMGLCEWVDYIQRSDQLTSEVRFRTRDHYALVKLLDVGGSTQWNTFLNTWI